MGDLARGEIAQPGRRPGAARIRPLSSVPLAASASRLPPGWCPIRCSISGPQTTTNRRCGLVIVLAISRSMPRFSVVSVPVIATSGPASAATAVASALSPSVQTATGRRTAAPCSRRAAAATPAAASRAWPGRLPPPR